MATQRTHNCGQVWSEMRFVILFTYIYSSFRHFICNSLHEHLRPSLAPILPLTPADTNLATETRMAANWQLDDGTFVSQKETIVILAKKECVPWGKSVGKWILALLLPSDRHLPFPSVLRFLSGIFEGPCLSPQMAPRLLSASSVCLSNIDTAN